MYNLRTYNSLYHEMELKYGVIFIHVPKTGGCSISKVLMNNSDGKEHIPVIKYKLLDESRFYRYFKFAFLRNPWDRFVSAYFFLRSGGKNIHDRRWSNQYLSSFNNFNEFVYSLQNCNWARKVMSWIHFLPQYFFICDNDLNILVDFIGTFENLSNDFDYIRNKLNLKENLPHLNKSYHKHYTKYYNEETKEIIKNLYEKDILLYYQYTHEYSLQV